MTQHFRDDFNIIATGKDPDDNQVVLFKDTRSLSDREMAVFGTNRDNSPVYGVKVVFVGNAMPVPQKPFDSGVCPNEKITGEDTITCRAIKANAERIFQQLIV